MKAVRRALPVVLMVWPYLFILYTMLPDGFSESVYIGFLISYIILTVVIYALNIWNAFTYQSEDAEYLSLIHISLPSKTMLPLFTGISPEIARRVVLFPAPLEPISVMISPSSTLSETSFRA